MLKCALASQAAVLEKGQRTVANWKGGKQEPVWKIPEGKNRGGVRSTSGSIHHPIASRLTQPETPQTFQKSSSINCTHLSPNSQEFQAYTQDPDTKSLLARDTPQASWAAWLPGAPAPFLGYIPFLCSLRYQQERFYTHDSSIGRKLHRRVTRATPTHRVLCPEIEPSKHPRKNPRTLEAQTSVQK